IFNLMLVVLRCEGLTEHGEKLVKVPRESEIAMVSLNGIVVPPHSSILVKIESGVSNALGILEVIEETVSLHLFCPLVNCLDVFLSAIKLWLRGFQSLRGWLNVYGGWLNSDLGQFGCASMGSSGLFSGLLGSSLGCFCCLFFCFCLVDLS